MQGAKILVIDDNPKVCEALKESLDRYQVVAAESGKEGLQVLRQPNDIDLVILDLKLPDVLGTDLLKDIKRLNPSLAVIMSTGYGSKDVVIRALQGRADDYIEKPFDVGILQSKIERLLSGTRANAESKIERVKRFLERNYDKAVSLNDAALIACLSPKYFSRFFKEKTGQTFALYRIKLRVNKAKYWLVESGDDVNQVGYRIGYENAESFTKAFKKITGETPTGYRGRIKTFSSQTQTVK